MHSERSCCRYARGEAWPAKGTERKHRDVISVPSFGGVPGPNTTAGSTSHAHLQVAVAAKKVLKQRIYASIDNYVQNYTASIAVWPG
jgi:hypothetical protein